MTRFFFLLLFPLLFTSCDKYKNNDYIWSIKSDSSIEYLVRGKNMDKIQSDIAELIFHINESDKDPIHFDNNLSSHNVLYGPKIQFESIEDNVIYVRVVNAEYLTQRMGSTGANFYLAETTFTLTEHPDINSVYFIFSEGDHAVPGNYKREDFLDYLKIK